MSESPKVRFGGLEIYDGATTRKIGSKHIDFGDLICKDDEIFVPLHCQRKKSKFAA